MSTTRYLNARLLRYSNRFAMNPEYLSFAQLIIEKKKVSDSINITPTKFHGQSLTASNLKLLCKVYKILSQDQAYLFLRQIPSTLLTGKSLCMKS